MIGRSPRAQQGIALLLGTLVILLVTAPAFLHSWNSAQGRGTRARMTESALRDARDALIAYAATHPSRPGKLPCPEEPAAIGTDVEGRAQSSCSNSSILVGRLPWRTLSLVNPEIALGEPLWYVLSPGFQGSITNPVNSNSIGQLQLDGMVNAAVALVIAPGPPLAGQNRVVPSASNPPDPSQYLDMANSAGPAYQSMGPATTFNDAVLALTREELFRAVEARVTREARRALEEYFVAYGYYPFPADFADAGCLGTASNDDKCFNTAVACNTTVCRGRLPANLQSPAAPWGSADLLRGPTGGTNDWFQTNGWRELIYYALAPASAEVTACTTCFLTVLAPPPSANGNLRVVTLGSGPALGSQTRATQADRLSINNYLEDKNLSPIDAVFVTAPISPGIPFNDTLAWKP